LSKGISSSIGFDAAFLFLGNGIQLISGTLFYVVLSHFFNPGVVGEITIFIAIITLGNVIFTFGLNVAVQHFVSNSIGDNKDNPKRIFTREILPLSIILAILSFISIYLLSSTIADQFLHNSSYIGLVQLASFITPFSIMFSILGGTILGLGKFKMTATLNIAVFSIYYAGAAIVAIRFHEITPALMVFLGSMIIGTVAGIILSFYGLSHYETSTVEKITKNQIMKYSTPLLFSQIISTGAVYADRLIVTGLMNQYALGIYTYALLFSTGIIFLSGPFNNILLTRLSYYNGTREINNFKSGVRYSLTILSGLIIPASYGLAAITPLVLNVIIGSKYVSGQYSMQTILLIIPFFVTSNIYQQALNSMKRTKVFLISSTASLLANFLISIALIPTFGLEGAAIGYSSTYVFSFFINAIMFRQEIKGALDWRAVSKIYIPSILMFIVVQLYYNFLAYNVNPAMALILEIALGAAVYKLFEVLLNPYRGTTSEFISSTFPDKRIFRILLSLIF
jgi:O-antigen/teichoic acid export membrane protein